MSRNNISGWMDGFVIYGSETVFRGEVWSNLRCKLIVSHAPAVDVIVYGQSEARISDSFLTVKIQLPVFSDALASLALIIVTD